MVPTTLFRWIFIMVASGFVPIDAFLFHNEFGNRPLKRRIPGWGITRTTTTSMYLRTARQQQQLTQRLYMSSEKTDSVTTTTVSATTTATTTTTLEVPLTLDAMIKQATTAMREAASAGCTRQIVRILLPRDKNNADLGRYFESDIDTF